jgi:hypothetical protein
MSKKLLAQALEFLEDNQHLVADNERHAYVMEYNSFIEQLKEALAKQEQGWTPERIAGMARLKDVQDKKLALAKQEQGEPVAWGNLANWCLDSDRVLITDKNAAEKYHRDIYDLTALYTTPQQRTWVSLTDEQMRKICGSVATMREAVREAEAILKEGNI